MIQDIKCILEDGLNMLQAEFNFLTVTQMQKKIFFFALLNKQCVETALFQWSAEW